MRGVVRAAVLSISALGLVGLAAGIGLGVEYHRRVVVDPGPHMQRSAVLAVVADESPVFFRDGSTRVGVFFDGEHRDFVPWEALPVAWTAAIVAAEDDGFWFHPGVDAVHVLRAVRDNLAAGALVAGGSTLTQQTAKNLFYRPDRSLRSKLDEGLNALRLEAHFGKHEILTFYANQFHVVGNGRGLGIAARYFFDAEPQALGLVECAFLAGLVKGPAIYDPFRGDEAARAAALERATRRTRYVLRRLADEPAARLAGGADLPGGEAARRARVEQIQALQVEARRLLDQGFELPFRKGTFRYEASALLDEVERRLGQPPFDDVLARAGVEDPAREGLQVVTTLDADAQRAATYALWHHLTEAGTMLEGLGPEAFRRPDGELVPLDEGRLPGPGEFRVARVVAVRGEGGPGLELDLGGATCVVDERAIQRVADAIKRGKARAAWSKSSAKDRGAVLAALPEGTNVWVSVREATEEGLRCDLEVRPELQGSVVVLEGGQVRAMVGGNDNRNFNRATALRQLGSTWKPLVAHAALELGWRPDDVLDNRRSVFAFSASVYAPRPDHEAPHEVSMARAMASSENLANVWLMYHLMDHLDPARVAELAQALGLARGEAEGEDAYALRIQKAGVLPTPSRVGESHLLLAKQEVLARLLAEGRSADAAAVRSVVGGWGVDEAQRGSGPGQVPTWSWLLARRDACLAAWAASNAAWTLGLPPMPVAEPLRWELRPEGQVAHCGGEGGVEGEPLASLPLAPVGTMRIDGRWSVDTVDGWASAVERRRLEHELAGDAAPGLYSPEVLYGHQDFRVLLGLRYLTRLAARYGVRTPLQEVLSLPLGASEITLEEAARLYEGLLSGDVRSFPGHAVGGARVAPPPTPALLVAAVRDVDHRLLYAADVEVESAATEQAGAMTRDLLRLVVEEGTARRAVGSVTVPGAPDAPLPLVGKTGTTNNHRNAAFVGALPAVAGGAVTGAWVVAVYVGYDDNRPLKSGGISLAGASGALPAWVGTAQGLARAGLLGRGPAPADGWRWPDPEGLVRVPYDPTAAIEADGDAPVQTLLVPAAGRGAPEVPGVDELALPEAPVRVVPEGEGAPVWFERPEGG